MAVCWRTGDCLSLFSPEQKLELQSIFVVFLTSHNHPIDTLEEDVRFHIGSVFLGGCAHLKRPAARGCSHAKAHTLEKRSEVSADNEKLTDFSMAPHAEVLKSY